jgi:flagellar protein FlaG
MFETINQTSSVQNSEKVPRTNEPLPTPDEKVTEVKKPVEEQKNNKDPVSQVFLDELEKDIAMIHNVGLRFSVHEPTGRTIVKVIDKESQETVREIPAEEVLNLAAKLDEMMGMIFDKTV